MEMKYSRKLASIQLIAEVRDIEGADKICAYRINDWWVVDQKHRYFVGEHTIYHEVDCLLPIGGAYDFLAARGTKKSELEDGTIVEGYRLRTIKLKGQVSQGLIMPVSNLGEHDGDVEIGTDVTKVLGIHKYERPLHASLRGTARGNFPSFLRKSDQERCQNLRRQIWDAYVNDDEFQVSVKLDGSSMTVFKTNEEIAEKWGTEARFGVCSRNLELVETEGNAFWSIARRDELEDKITSVFHVALQGELISPTIQGNFEGVDRPDFYVYNVWDIEEGKFLPPQKAVEICRVWGVKHVPVLHERVTLCKLFPTATEDTIVQMLLDYADGPSSFGGKFREGVVFKRYDGQFSFKAISNKYLLKEKDDE